MTGPLTSIELRDDQGDRMGGTHYTTLSGWLWACSLCPAANAPGRAPASPVEAVRRLAEHIESRHP